MSFSCNLLSQIKGDKFRLTLSFYIQDFQENHFLTKQYGSSPLPISRNNQFNNGAGLILLLCPQYKTETDTKDSLYPPGFVPPNNLQKHSTTTGCEHCYYTGYSGRKAI